jgi:hypothetical protein
VKREFLIIRCILTAPIFAVVWLTVQIVCKIVVTWKGSGDGSELTSD